MKRTDFVVLRFPRSERRVVPDGSKDLATRRTSFLLAHVEHEPLPSLLASAWMQGVEDATQAFASRPAGKEALEQLCAAPPAEPAALGAMDDEPWPL